MTTGRRRAVGTDRAADASGPVGRAGVAPDPDRISAAVLRCDSVHSMSGGPFGAVATYLPGRRVVGVNLRPDPPPDGLIEVHVVGRYGLPVTGIADEVRAAVGTVVGTALPVTVFVEDLAMGEEATGSEATPDEADRVDRPQPDHPQPDGPQADDSHAGTRRQPHAPAAGRPPGPHAPGEHHA